MPGACNVKSYQLREKWNWIWIWPGDPELADESLIPDHFEIGVTNPAYHAVRGLRLDIAARYQLLNDNLLDLQHLEVLHAGILGNDGIGQADEERGSGEDWILSARKMRDIELPKAFQPFFGQRRVDRTLTMNWHIPGLHVGPDIFTVPEGEPDAGREIMQVIAYHALTPARRNSCHYFVTFARSFAHGDEAVDQAMLKSFRGVLDQDVFAAEEIEKQLQNASTPQKEILFKSDATLVIGRRLLEQIIAAETT
ncbi:hypothetical protein NSU_3149 [Novosphingobium pentaromativorans US6-1]|uniref:Vanillate O-demethylase oxygenase-like C-terminal catalytic domain-containing protein n=1 Tax=Novosphingobium pentaromativorans US6-1 TaxID=1088721 RepID=G6EFM8_9SPHN|nr:hypothetical protein NSU_3149 [Novosphingobium pentaromativorans US6-1]